ncbi:Uncharacterised protein [Rhodococcus gordoniae]|uniref:Uncharacterized protein n=1 Tax=Rhodococcus gordoniae TaxID=223392 RepID=A0A379LXC9_9NOCA|nr:Uncharacterised protein [Rhodococcus gordoniae]
MASRSTSTRPESQVLAEVLSHMIPAEVLRNLDSAERRGQVVDKRDKEFCSSLSRLKR